MFEKELELEVRATALVRANASAFLIHSTCSAPKLLNHE